MSPSNDLEKLVGQTVTFTCVVEGTPTPTAGADPEIEEGGGGIHIKWGLVRRAYDAVVCARASLVPRPSRIRRLQYVASRRLQYVACS